MHGCAHAICTIAHTVHTPSSPRRRGPNFTCLVLSPRTWAPAFAGVTKDYFSDWIHFSTCACRIGSGSVPSPSTTSWNLA